MEFNTGNIVFFRRDNTIYRVYEHFNVQSDPYVICESHSGEILFFNYIDLKLYDRSDQ